MDADDFDDLLRRLEELARQDQDLAREFLNSAERFHGGGSIGTGAEATAAAEQRHREYFLLERVSERYGTTPVLRFVAAGAGDENEALMEALCGSHTSLFEIQSLEDETDQSVQAEDLTSGRLLTIRAARFGGATVPGDLIVGRVFPEHADEAVLSSGAARFSSRALDSERNLVEAVKRDLATARQARPRPGRFSQLELEDLFFRARIQPVPALEHVEAALHAFLREAGSEFGRQDDRVRALANAASSAGEFLGPLMEELAFESECNLNTARRLGLEYWHALQVLKAARKDEGSSGLVAPPSAAEAPVSGARAAAIAAFESGRAAGRDLDSLFEELSLALGLEDDEEADDDQATDWDDVIGIAPIIDEYAWDRERLGQPLAPDELSQARFMAASWDEGPRKPDSVDALNEAMLADYALLDLPRSLEANSDGDDAAASAERLARGWQHLHAFCAWLDAEHFTALTPIVHTLRERWFEDAQRCLELSKRDRSQPAFPQRPAPSSNAGSLWVRAASNAEKEHLEIVPLVGSKQQPSSASRARALQLPGAEGIRAGDLLRVEFSTVGEELKPVRLIEVLPGGAAESVAHRQGTKMGKRRDGRP